MKKSFKYILVTVITMIILTIASVYASSTINGSQVTYDNTSSKLSSTNVQGAIDEIYSSVNSKTTCPDGYYCKAKKSSPEVGDYVKMTPTLTSYTTDTSKTGYTSTQTINPSELNLWRVLKVNSDGTMEMISEYTSSTTVYFRGKVGYQNLVGYLNILASKYENSKYTSGSRYVGYNGQTEYISSSLDSIVDSLTGTITDNPSDTLYEKDCELVKSSIGTLTAFKVRTSTKTSYWLASRNYYYSTSASWHFYGRIISTLGNVVSSSYSGLYYYSAGGFYANSDNNALRPIVILKSGITYTPASGTSEDPFVLN